MKKYTHIILLLCAIFFLNSCSLSKKSLQPTIEANVLATVSRFTKVPSSTAYPTLTPYPTYTVVPTYTPKYILVTPTFTNTPLQSPTPSSTPTETMTPTKTKSLLTQDKGPGFYLVNIDIAPGVWRSQGTGDSCYWSVTRKTGDIIDNHFGMAGGTMYIPDWAFQVELNKGCGDWIYLGE